MKLTKAIIENYKGVNTSIEIMFDDLCCIVGKNDVGKSTILKAVDAFINENNPTIDDKNIFNDSNNISIELQFDCHKQNIILDDIIPVTFEEEELVNENNRLCVKKVWDVSQKTIKPKIFIIRKKYNEDDFIMLDERGLMALCKKLTIETSKGNGEVYNNKEKREKIRTNYAEKQIEFSYITEELPTTGQTRLKKIFDAIKTVLPSFEYFRADRSLSDSDTSVQKYFKDKAFSLLKEEINTENIESEIRKKIALSLATITDKINSVVSANEQVSAKVDFDWSKLISTSFRCTKEDANIPLTSRGDGFRRITMMSYFEMLAEEKKGDINMIFGFEEPETFLHPETQKQLYNSLISMKDNGYQIFVTTHSPNIVAETDRNDIVFVSRNQENQYQITQNNDIEIKTIVEELGIKSNNMLFAVFDKVKCMFLVEGPDDVIAYTHTVQQYKKAGKVDKTFEELGVMLVPVGGCGAIKHWTNFQIIKQIGKPYFILLDSDKESADMESPNLKKLHNFGYTDVQCAVTRKREIECYIPCDYFKSLTPSIIISYSEWDDVKKICKEHLSAGILGGKNVCERHFMNLNYDQLRSTFCPNGIDNNDEFLSIYNTIRSLI